MFCFFVLVIAPGWAMGVYLHRKAGSALFPSIRPGKDHEHMAPRLITHLKENNFEDKEDYLGRRNASFYRNFIR